MFQQRPAPCKILATMKRDYTLLFFVDPFDFETFDFAVFDFGFVDLFTDLAPSARRAGWFPSACAAISIDLISSAAGATAPEDTAACSAGNFCFKSITGSNRSPIFSTRLMTSLFSNTSSPASFFLRHFSTSSHDTGVDTVGCSRARRE